MFRILSLDGGGIKGSFTASVLTALEESTNRSISEHFDLITGTSTGGILAIGLGLGFTAKELLDFYLNRGPIIFRRSGRPFSVLRWLFGPKHSHSVLREELHAILGDRKFGESKCRLVIPTYDANAGRIFLLKTAHDPRFVDDISALAIDVALATSASGLAQWNLGVVDLMFAAQVEAARAQAGLLAQGRLHRIDFAAMPGQYSLDNAKPEIIEALVGIGRGEATKKANLDVVRARFLDGNPVRKFVPFKAV